MPVTNHLKEELIRRAKEVASHSYSPYSSFAVGAALLCENGEIYVGTNVENSSYGLSMCAERTAIGNAISSKNQQIVAIAIFSPHADSLTPCGACRQVIAEFGKDIEVIYPQKGVFTSATIQTLIPSVFSL